jgi:hypothetical protein
MSDRHAILRELGALLGHRDPERFAEFVLAPPCEHHGAWTFDPELCPPPCGQAHEWCTCGRPMKPPCPIVEETT